MRTIVELPEESIKRLDTLKKKKNASRAELIRRAVQEYLQSRSPDIEEGQSAFGLWSKRKVDGLTYQEDLRQEW